MSDKKVIGKKIKMFSMFTGIGGFEKGVIDAGLDVEVVGYSEINKYAISIYKKHFPESKNYGSATDIIPEQLPDFEILVGGFPCQAFSIAGKRRGFEDTRGTLFFEIARIAKCKRPKYLLLENVSGLLSHEKGITFEIILAAMDELGYDAEWEVLNSKNFGVPQNRERVFIIGHLREYRGREIFPIGEICSEINGIQSEEQEEREWLSGGVHEAIRNKTSIESRGGNVNDLVQIGIIGKDSEATRVYDTNGIARTMKNGGGMGAKTGLYAVNQIGTRTDFGTQPHQQDRVYDTEGISPALQSQLPEWTHKIAVAIETRTDEGIRTFDGNISGALHTTAFCGDKGIMFGTRIRRLTPVECERLQHYPDGWTETGIDEKGNEVKISDSQRYKCLGNSVTTSVISAIIERIYE